MLGPQLLGPCYPQTAHAIAINSSLPRDKLLKRQLVAIARLAYRQKATVYRSYYLRLAPRDPTRRALTGQIFFSKNFTARTNNFTYNFKHSKFPSAIRRIYSAKCLMPSFLGGKS
jgi:hypothetical protein